MTAEKLFALWDLALMDVLGILLFVWLVARLNPIYAASREGYWKSPLSALAGTLLVWVLLRSAHHIPTVDPNWAPVTAGDWFVAGSDWLLHGVITQGVLIVFGILVLYLIIAVKNRWLDSGEAMPEPLSDTSRWNQEALEPASK